VRRQQFYHGTGQPGPTVASVRQAGSRGAGPTLILALLAVGALLSAYGYWSPWSVLTGNREDPFLATAASLPGEPPLLAPASGPAPVTLAVAIPPVPPPLVAAALAGLPAVVTPASTGGAIPAAPILVRSPRMPTGSIPGVLRLPAANGPFPAIILLHGCNGPFNGMPDWAYRLNAWGYAVLMPDSMTPRGVKTVCDPGEQPKVTPYDRVGDIGAAATWLRTRPEIKPDRIAVLGLSHGGTTAALAVQAPYIGIRLRAAVDYYGPCHEPRLQGPVPLLVLAGEADDWGDPAARCRAYGRELRSDQRFEIHTYPGVFHAFDSGPKTRTTFSGHVLAYDKVAAEDSFTRVHAFLDREVKY
jgi:dienelactone hydrolase